MGEAPAAGWYDDPVDPTLFRFWDGRAWTHDTLVRAAIESTAQVGSPSAPGLKGRLSAFVERDRDERRRRQELSRAQAVATGTAHAQALDEALTQVRAAAARGAILEEESARTAMLTRARSLGGAALVKSALAQLAAAEQAGEVRIGAAFIGTVKSEGFFSQYARKEAMSKVRTGKTITVYSDRLFHGDDAYVIDAHTNAQVFLDGLEQITQRPTLTRMALLAPLPGSALIPGLALQKKKKNDMRHAEFVVASTDWAVSTPVNPDAISEPRRIAQMINCAADARAASPSPSPMTSPMTTPTVPMPAAPAAHDLVGQLERLSALRAQGALTEAEFDEMKARLLAGGDHR